MFKKFRLRNYRTHIDTTLELKDVTLLIGSNNSGKSNMLAGLNHFSMLVNRTFPGGDITLKASDFFPHKHSLNSLNIPIFFYCEWERLDEKVEYELEIYCMDMFTREIGCKEKIVITTDKPKEFTHGISEPSQEMLLRTKLKTEELGLSGEISLSIVFFHSLASMYSYHFQPGFLKKEAFSELFSKSGEKPSIAVEIGREGTNFQGLVKYVKEHEQEAYGKFLGYLKRFVKSFNEIIIDKGAVKWQFDMGGSEFPYFAPGQVSDGLVKAGAIALLCAMRTPPAMIMIEEVENGINHKKLSEFLSWLSQTADKGKRTQFIITSHSPSVLREFSSRLDAVYNFYLREKGYKTLATNLNDAIKPLINMGTIEEENIVERDGKQVIQVKPYKLTELFYNGVIGEL